MKPVKLKPCKICKREFVPRSTTAKYCGFDCALAGTLETKAKDSVKIARAERVAHREAKVKLKTRRDYIKECQTAFNAYIRARDAGKLCICCDKPLAMEAVGGGYDCGHYRSVGSAPHLRFDERNAHGQTKQCNRWGSGRAVDYRIGLILRIGLKAVDELEFDQTVKKYTIEDLKEIKAEYKRKLKGLKNAP